MKSIFVQLITNKYVVIPLLTWFLIQLFKVIYDYVKLKEFKFKKILESGGMPSSHSAVVVAMAVMIGKEKGFDSSIFALALMFALIVMYDAAGVRRSTGEQAIVLNKIIENSDLSELKINERLAERLGHRPVEVLMGAMIGLIVGVIA